MWPSPLLGIAVGRTNQPAIRILEDLTSSAVALATQWAVNHSPGQISRSSVHPDAQPSFPEPMGHQRLALVPASRSVPSPQSGAAIVVSVLTPSRRSIVSLLFSHVLLYAVPSLFSTLPEGSVRKRERERESLAERVRASLLSPGIHAPFLGPLSHLSTWKAGGGGGRRSGPLAVLSQERNARPSTQV
jgi:hypothetical protein